MTGLFGLIMAKTEFDTLISYHNPPCKRTGGGSYGKGFILEN